MKTRSIEVTGHYEKTGAATIRAHVSEASGLIWISRSQYDRAARKLLLGAGDCLALTSETREELEDLLGI